jgi:DNA topoisomerase-1
MEHLRSAKHDDFFVLRDGAAGLFLGQQISENS